MAEVAPGRVRFSSEAPALVLETNEAAGVAVRLGNGSATLSSSAGGWGEVARPKRAALTEWEGHAARRVTVPVLIDGWRTRSSVEAACTTLERLGRALPGEAGTPVVKVAGNVPRADLEYVIDGIEWGPALWVGRVRVRQEVTVTLLEYVPGADLVVKATPLGGKPRLYRVRKGDNLKRIAAKLLGNANRWREIATLNRRRGWRLPASMVGKNLKVPPR